MHEILAVHTILASYSLVLNWCVQFDVMYEMHFCQWKKMELILNNTDIDVIVYSSEQWLRLTIYSVHNDI